MRIKKFEDIVAWQKGGELSLAIYKQFRENNDFGFKDQIQRASVSNVAEGFERRTDKEFINFLYIAKGSCGEVRSMLYLARRLNYIDDRQFNYFCELSIEISKLLSGLIKSLS